MWPPLPILVVPDVNGWILGEFGELGLDIGYAFAVSQSNCLEDVPTYFEWEYYDVDEDDWVPVKDSLSISCYTSGNEKYSVRNM